MHTYKKATNSMLIVLEAKLKWFEFHVNEGLREASSQTDRSTLLNVGSPATERERRKRTMKVSFIRKPLQVKNVMESQTGGASHQN